MPRILLISLLVFAFHSCTVQKRLYQKGWHVEWKQHTDANDSHSSGNSYTSSRENEAMQAEEQSPVRVAETHTAEAEAAGVPVENVADTKDAVNDPAIVPAVVSAEAVARKDTL